MSKRVVFHEIGHKSETGAVLIAEDTYVPEWVIRGAPYSAVKSVFRENGWIIVDQFGGIHGYSTPPMDEDAAKRQANQMNLHAATAIMLTEG